MARLPGADAGGESEVGDVSASVDGNSALPGQLLTADQLAERWQVPKSHVYRLAREGKLPVVSLGRYKRFRLAAVEGFELEGGCPE